MKKQHLLVFVIILMLLYLSLYGRTKQYDNELSCIKYQLGNDSYEEKIKIRVVGVFKTSLLGKCKFSGKIFIEDFELNCSKFDENNMAMLTYNDNGYTKTFGQIFINEGLSELTILYNGWSDKDGLMVSSPAKDRKEALEISNQLMEKFLRCHNIEKLFILN